MTVSQTPAPARSDVVGPTPGRTGTTLPFLYHGTLLAAGALAWAGASAAVGLDPQTRSGVIIFSIGSGLFQVGLLALLRVLARTRALGTGRIARTALVVESVLVLLALASTAADGLGVSDLSQPGWALLDAFWPLSMLGMFGIGITIAVAGRWHGVRRFWPMIAESWAIITIPTLMVFGPAVAAVVAPLHLLVGYLVLGVLVATKRSA